MPIGSSDIELTLGVVGEDGIKKMTTFKLAVTELTQTVVDSGKKAEKEAKTRWQKFADFFGRFSKSFTNQIGRMVGAIATLGKIYVKVFLGMKLAVAGFVAVNLLAMNKLRKSVMEATEDFKRFEITLTGALGSRKRAREIGEFVEALAIKTPVELQDIQGAVRALALIPTTRVRLMAKDFDTVTNSIEGMVETVLGLSTLNPEQGVGGAIFALR